MRIRRGLGRKIIIAILFVTAVAIPVYFITDAYIEREDPALLARVEITPSETPTPTETPIFPPTWTPRPSSTPSSTPSETPTPSPTPTEILIPTTGYDFSLAYIKNVVHLPEAGGRTMVTIVVPGTLEGDFFGQVEIQPDFWQYECVMLAGSEDHLFCFGDRLPESDDAIIRVFERLEERGDPVMVFEAEFEVFKLMPTKTNTPAGPRPTARDTSTPTATPTPPPTSTPTPTNTPPPTATFTPGPPPSPQATPITPTATP